MTQKSKVSKSFQAKKPVHRTREEINREYADQALQIGHKARLISESEAECTKLQDQVQEHLAIMIKLNAEAMALPPVVLQSVPEATPTPEQKETV